MATVRLTAAALAGRLAGAASRIAHRGTGASIQGKVMLKLDPSALGKLLAGKRIAAVSGTNGKTTTTHLLAAALRESLNHDGNRLVHNADGANLHHGLASALSSRPEAQITISGFVCVGDDDRSCWARVSQCRAPAATQPFDFVVPVKLVATEVQQHQHLGSAESDHVADHPLVGLQDRSM